MRPVTLVRAVPRAPAGLGGTVEESGVVHLAILALVWTAFALSGFVMSEPAPIDAMLAGLAVLMPMAGLVAVTPALAAYIALWGIAGACGYIAATVSRDVAGSTVFTSVSLYLYIASFMLAGFVARAPVRHSRLILSGWTAAAVLTAILALVGYFDLIPAAREYFTKFERASGTFKDPNVFGPFLVAPFLYTLHLILSRPLIRALFPAIAAAVLALGVLLSFSRGAWINLTVALLVYGGLAYLTASSGRQRDRQGR